MKTVNKKQVGALLLVGLFLAGGAAPRRAPPGGAKKKKKGKSWTAQVIENVFSWLPIIRKYAGPLGQFPTVPLQVAMSVMHPESGGQPTAISPAGAYGLMQLMPKTARGLGLTVNKSRDDRKNPELNIYGGIKLLAELRAGQEKYAAKYAKKNAANPDESKRVLTSAQIWDRVYAAYNSGNPDPAKRREYIRMVRAAYPFYKDIN